MAYFLNAKNIIGVEFVFTKWGKVHPLGKLLYHPKEEHYTFQYYPEYVRLDNMPQLTTELFLSDTVYKSKGLFLSLNWFIADQIPDIMPGWKTPLQRLCEIQIPIRGMHAYPIYYTDFTTKMFLDWCKEMQLSLPKMCAFFDVSRSSIKNMRGHTMPNAGKEVLKRLSLYYYVQDAFNFLMDTRGYLLNPNQKQAALNWEKKHFVKPYKIATLEDHRNG